MTIKRDDFLIEIQTEELPPKSLLKLAEAFQQAVKERVIKADLAFKEFVYYASPRRLAVHIIELAAAQPGQTVERKGPAVKAAFDAEGNPTPACVGFAKTCGVSPDELIRLTTPQGEWLAYSQQVAGKTVADLMPGIIEQALKSLPIAKRMRWGASRVEFVRPVHSVIMLYGDTIIPATILGCETGRVTHGHRFHAPFAITIPHASLYASLLGTEGHVMVDFAKRRQDILMLTQACVEKQLKGKQATCFIDPALLDEVTGLVEWPMAYMGAFEETFLSLPAEVLMSAMQDHQRYFPMKNAAGDLLAHFITISNVESHEAARLIHGNERVLRARLADAAFFYAVDKKISLSARRELLKGMVFQAKLGTIFAKTERVSRLAAYLAKQLNYPEKEVSQAALLAKSDLTTQVVGEFPELQGIMGGYYARLDGEDEAIAVAIKEQYLPRFAEDKLPATQAGQVLAIADRIDTVIGSFGINNIPTGDKDPYGLRRAMIGVIRILVENNIVIDLQQILEFAFNNYEGVLSNQQSVEVVLAYLQERLRAWYLDKGIAADVFAAVAAIGTSNPADVDKRIGAVQAFKKLQEAETLSIANKRVSNILAKYADKIAAKSIDASFFEHPAEKQLADLLEQKSQSVARLHQQKNYETLLLQLAELRVPIDNFFDHVMVMTEDKSRRENRLLLLAKLRALFLQVADIALLQ